MAAPVNIQANLTLNPSSINASAKQVQQALGRITGQASEFQKSLDASTARVFAFGATTSVINGVTQSFKQLVSTTVNVQAKLLEINSILGAGAAEFNNYRNAIFQVAKNTGQSFKTVADGAAELARQGLGATESAKRLEAALILTRISGLGAEQSVKALTAAMNGFTSAGLDAQQVINKIVAVDTKFAVSAQDLADGFSRAGSTAEDAGVKFEELLGLITAVEQRTARGGAVIGNAFKSIFTRLSRGDTIASLQELGVAINANQSGVQKLQALSKALDSVSDPTIASQIKELAGGVFQINVVSAALKDLGNDASIFGQATKTAFAATNEATQKNQLLNESILAQINSLTASVTSFAEKLGGITFGPLLQNLVGIATSLSESLDNALDPEKGNKFIQGLFKIIGTFLSGPGLAIFTVAFAKIFKTVLKFAAEGFKTIMQMGSATERIRQIEGGIVDLLSKDAKLRQILGSSTASQLQKEQAVIAAIKQQNALLTQQQALVNSAANAARAAGVSGYGGGAFTGKRGRRYANGGVGQMEPDLMTAMVNESKEAPKGSVPYVTNFRGKPAVMNTSEMQVRINGREEILREDQIPRFNKGSGKGSKGIVSKGKYAYLIPKVGARGSLPPSTIGGQKFQGGAVVRGPQKSAIQGASDSAEANLEGQVKKNLFNSAAQWTQKLQPLGRQATFKDVQRGFQTIAGAKGALKAAVGAAFEVGITKSLDYQAAQREKGGDFDVRGGANIDRVQKLFGISERIADFKASLSSGNVKSFYSKVGKERSAGAITKGENEKVAKRRAIERDRRINPQFYDSKGNLKKTSGASLAQSNRIMGSRKRFLNIQNMAKGSLPNFKIRRFNEGSFGGVDPLMMMMMMGGMARTGGGSEMSEQEANIAKGKADAARIRRRNFAVKNFPTFRKAGRGLGNIGKSAGNLLGKIPGGRMVGSVLGKTRGSFGAGIAGSLIGGGLSAYSQNLEKTQGTTDTSRTAGILGTTASYAGTGAMLAGPAGAVIGAGIGLGMEGLNARKQLKAEQERGRDLDRTFVNRRIAINQTRGLESRLLGGNFTPERRQQMRQDLSKAAAKTGIPILQDLGPELEKSKKALMGLEAGTAEFDKAYSKYSKQLELATNVVGQTDWIKGVKDKLENVQEEMSDLIRNNAGKKLKDSLDPYRRQNEMRSSILSNLKGPGAEMMRDANLVQSQFATAGMERGNLMDLQRQLQGLDPRDKEGRADLMDQIKEASTQFKDTVMRGALAINDMRQKAEQQIIELRAKREEIRENTISSSARGLIDNLRDPNKISLTRANLLGGQLRSTYAKGDKRGFARGLAGLENVFGAERINDPKQLAAILKSIGFNTTKYKTYDTDPMKAEKERANRVIDQRLAFMTQAQMEGTFYKGVGGRERYAGQREDLFGAITETGQNQINMGKIDENIAQLDAKILGLSADLVKFGEAFNQEKLISSLNKMSEDMTAAAGDVTAAKAQVQKIGDATDKITNIVKSANTMFAEEEERLKTLQTIRHELMGRMKTLEDQIKQAFTNN